jgi:cytochrome c oxidase cbb3-type subunit IV
MEINLLRTVVTVTGLLLFVALVAWTWRPGRRAALEDAARAPFDGEAETRR